MKVSELIKELELNIVAGADGLYNDVRGCYIGDLMSMAMAKVEEGNAWITIQTNLNVIAVATLKEASCVILADGCMPDENAKVKADAEEIPILTTEHTAYEMALRLGELNI